MLHRIAFPFLFASNRIDCRDVYGSRYHLKILATVKSYQKSCTPILRIVPKHITNRCMPHHFVYMWFVVCRERLLFYTQFRAHFGKCSGDEAEPPLLIRHAPEYFGVWRQTPPIVHSCSELNLFHPVCLCQPWFHIFAIRRVTFMILQPILDRFIAAPSINMLQTQ